jgi:hypothetical protein
VKIFVVVRHGVVGCPTKVGVRRRTKVGVIGSRDLLPTQRFGNSTVMLSIPLLLDFQDYHSSVLEYSRTKYGNWEVLTTRTLSGAADVTPTAANMSDDCTSTTVTVNSLKSHLNGCRTPNTNGSANDTIAKGGPGPLAPDLNDDQHTQPNGTSGLTNLEIQDMPIAICGMGLRLPGGLRTPSELFDLLVGKKDGKMKIPKERVNVEAYYNASNPKQAGSLATPYAYLIDEDQSQFDTSMFKMSNAEVASADPSQRLLLEVTREAFESAGEANFRGKDIGTFLGDFTTGWEDLQDMDFQHTAAHRVMGKLDFVLPNRLAFEYDLLGPSVAGEGPP